MAGNNQDDYIPWWEKTKAPQRNPPRDDIDPKGAGRTTPEDVHYPTQNAEREGDDTNEAENPSLQGSNKDNSKPGEDSLSWLGDDASLRLDDEAPPNKTDNGSLLGSRRDVEGPSPLGQGSIRSLDQQSALYTPDAWSFHSYPVPQSRYTLPRISESERDTLQPRLPWIYLDPGEDPYHWQKTRDGYKFTGHGLVERPTGEPKQAKAPPKDSLRNGLDDLNNYKDKNNKNNPENKFTLVADALGENNYDKYDGKQTETAPGEEDSLKEGLDEVDGQATRREDDKSNGNQSNSTISEKGKKDSKNKSNKKKRKRWQELNDNDLDTLQYV